jgi:hypothetical protein
VIEVQTTEAPAPVQATTEAPAPVQAAPVQATTEAPAPVQAAPVQATTEAPAPVQAAPAPVQAPAPPPAARRPPPPPAPVQAPPPAPPPPPAVPLYWTALPGGETIGPWTIAQCADRAKINPGPWMIAPEKGDKAGIWRPLADSLPPAAAARSVQGAAPPPLRNADPRPAVALDGTADLATIAGADGPPVVEIEVQAAIKAGRTPRTAAALNRWRKGDTALTVISPLHTLYRAKIGGSDMVEYVVCGAQTLHTDLPGQIRFCRDRFGDRGYVAIVKVTGMLAPIPGGKAGTGSQIGAVCQIIGTIGNGYDLDSATIARIVKGATEAGTEVTAVE